MNPRHAAPQAGLSIRYSLPLLIATLVAVVLTIYAAAAYVQVRESAVESEGQRLRSVTEQLSVMLAGSVATYEAQAVGVAADTSLAAFLRSGGATDSARAREALATPGAAGAGMYRRELLDSSLRTLLAAGGDLPPGARSEQELTQLIERARGGVGQMRVMGDSLVVPVVAPVTVDGTLAGYLVVWRRVAATGQSAVEQLIGADARMYVANADGDLWTDLSQPVAGPPLPLDGSTGAAARGIVEYDRAGADTWLAGLSAVPGAPWVVVVEVPRAVVIATARGMLRTLVMLGVLALFLAAAATWALAGRFTAPIMELARTARAFSAGDYTRRSSVSRRDEIGTLSGAFNGMADNVEGAHSALEQNLENLALLESRHREVGERLHQMLASSPDVIYEMETANGPVFTWVSDNVERLLGVTPREVTSEGWWQDHLHPDDRVAPVQDAAAFSADGEAMREYRLRHADDSYRWIRDRQRLVNGGGRLVGAWSDVTELRQLEEQFRQAQKLEAVGRLAGGIAHDFNNIVTVILGESDMALSTLPPASPIRESLDEVRAAAERASLLTRQLLTFSRKQLTETAVVNLNDVVRDIRGMLGRLIGEDLELQFRLSGGLGDVVADRSQIEQVVVNLVINARDAMPHGGTIMIETRNVTLDADYGRSDPIAGEYVGLIVTDTGTGMSTEVLEHLFEPFFTTKGPGKGTGLGLATCYGIARQFGGHIDVYSEVGVGTAMKLYLPRTRAPGRAPEARETPDALARGTETILLVEDEPQVRAIVARMLAAQGYHVIVAANGDEALTVIEREEEDEIDLLLTDLVMPRMGGRELAERVRLLRPHLPVLFTSGYTEDVIMQNRLLEHDISLLHKPFTRLELATKVREALDAPRIS
ncbi:MAG TPA: ATP-binding protein [Longimicrobiales bacterium]|nr:ATP-binding protein [Longimicrobiales bacterium]